jgi:hypothetical protein
VTLTDHRSSGSVWVCKPSRLFCPLGCAFPKSGLCIPHRTGTMPGALGTICPSERGRCSFHGRHALYPPPARWMVPTRTWLSLVPADRYRQTSRRGASPRFVLPARRGTASGRQPAKTRYDGGKERPSWPNARASTSIWLSADRGDGHACGPCAARYARGPWD